MGLHQDLAAVCETACETAGCCESAHGGRTLARRVTDSAERQARPRWGSSVTSLLLCGLILLGAPAVRAEAILQLFETPWAEVEARMPEIAAAGYGAIWLPPPTKGTEGKRDVGFALYDRFDIGDQFARGTVATRYGTKDDLKRLVDVAHRFGIRVYFDVVMNHNGNPHLIENTGLMGLDMVDNDEWPGMSPWDFHLLPAHQPEPNESCGGQMGCDWCAFQPSVTNIGRGMYATVYDDSGTIRLNDGGVDVCMFVDEQRIAAMPLGDAFAFPDSPPMDHPVFDGQTHLVRSPRVSDFDSNDGFNFNNINYALLGLVDVAIEQYVDGTDDAFHTDSTGALSIDGYNAVNGLPLSSYIRHPGRDDLYPDSAPIAEDPREMMMRWIRWLMLEVGADGFRLDAIKHAPPTFYGENFPGDPIAFNKVIQDTYDEQYGLTDVDDTDGIDDAAIFGESFTGSCAALRPYIRSGMRVLDFPLFFKLHDMVTGTGDIGQFSVQNPAGCEDIGAFGGMNRLSGVAFANSHDECQVHESRTTNDWSHPEFSRCFPNAGNPDLVYAFVLTRAGDSTVFFDGNNWTNQSFVRSGRPDALGDSFNGGPQTVVPTLVNAHRRAARGGQNNLYVDADAYAYERVVDGHGAASLVILNDRWDVEAKFGSSAGERPFVLTRFPPGTELVDLTGNALEYARTVTVLDPDTLTGNDATVVQNAKDHFLAINGYSADVIPDLGVFYTGVPNGPSSSYVVYAPLAYRAPATGDVLSFTGGVGADLTVTTAVDKALPDGTQVDDASATLVHVTGSTFNVELRVDDVTAPDNVGLLLDGEALGGTTPITGSNERFLDGYSAPDTDVVDGADRVFTWTIDANDLDDGVHGVRVHITKSITGAADAQDFFAVGVCVGDANACQPQEPSDPMPDGGVVEPEPTPDVDGGVEPDVDAGNEPDPQPGVDAGEEPVDGGNEPDADAGNEPDPQPGVDGGEPEPAPDGGVVNPDDDDDNDGVRNADDNCPQQANAGQADFDDDGVGDECDLCPATQDVQQVQEDGCPAPTTEQADRIAAIALAIAQSNFVADLDVNNDGALNVLDLHLAIADVHEPAAASSNGDVDGGAQ